MDKEEKIEKPEATIIIKQENKGCFSGCSNLGEGCGAAMILMVVLGFILATIDQACNCGILDEEVEATSKANFSLTSHTKLKGSDVIVSPN